NAIRVMALLAQRHDESSSRNLRSAAGTRDSRCQQPGELGRALGIEVAFVEEVGGLKGVERHVDVDVAKLPSPFVCQCVQSLDDRPKILVGNEWYPFACRSVRCKCVIDDLPDPDRFDSSRPVDGGDRVEV